MNHSVSAQPPVAVSAQRRTSAAAPATGAPADPQAGGVKSTADSVTISSAARGQGEINGQAASGGIGAANGNSPMSAEQRLMAGLKQSYATKAGDARFDAQFDFNNDGAINAGDLNMLRQKLTQDGAPGEPVSSAPPAPPTVDSIRDAFFTRAGEDGFDAAADLNGDGVVNAGDLAMLRQSMQDAGEMTQPVPFAVTGSSPDAEAMANPTAASAVGVDPTTTPAVDPATAAPGIDAMAAGVGQTMATTDAPGPAVEAPIADPRANLLEAIREAFFSRAGDDRFNAMLDGNGDGIINVADLISIRERV